MEYGKRVRQFAGGKKGWSGSALLGALSAGIDWCIAPLVRSKDVEQVRRARLIAVYAWTLIVLALAYSILFFLMNSPIGCAAVVMGAGTAVVSLLVLRRSGSPLMAGNLLAAGFFGSLTAVACRLGGHGALVLAWYAAVPAVAVSTSGRRSAVFWLVMIVAALTTFYAFDRGGFSFPDDLAPGAHRLFHLLSLVGLVVLVLHLAVTYETGKDWILSRVQESEERFRRFAEASGYGFGMGEPNGQVVFGNATILRIVEEDTEEAFKSNVFLRYYLPEDAEYMKQEVLPVVFEKGQWVGEIALVSAKGNVIATEQNIFLIRDDRGQPRMIGNIVTDITERKRSEEKQEELIARLEVQNAELERFAYTVSHDLKSPLITIKGFVGVLAEDLAKKGVDFAQNDLGRISRAADTMSQLLDDLLELSRIGQLLNAPERFSMTELVSEVTGLLDSQLDARGIQVECVSEFPTVCGDRVRLLEVMQNLIDNASKYMGDEPQPRIEIGSYKSGEKETVCYVRDNGIGIESRYHERIFGLFDQLDPNVTGSGIGLALVKRIVELHGGRIWVESEGSGHGSTFCFTIPVEPSLSGFQRCDPKAASR